jgi:hypothetical protein
MDTFISRNKFKVLAVVIVIIIVVILMVYFIPSNQQNQDKKKPVVTRPANVVQVRTDVNKPNTITTMPVNSKPIQVTTKPVNEVQVANIQTVSKQIADSVKQTTSVNSESNLSAIQQNNQQLQPIDDAVLPSFGGVPVNTANVSMSIPVSINPISIDDSGVVVESNEPAVKITPTPFGDKIKQTEKKIDVMEKNLKILRGQANEIRDEIEKNNKSIKVIKLNLTMKFVNPKEKTEMTNKLNVLIKNNSNLEARANELANKISIERNNLIAARDEIKKISTFSVGRSINPAVSVASASPLQMLANPRSPIYAMY